MEHFISSLAFGFGMHNVASLVMRIAAGAFFFLSGYHKLFNRDRHSALVNTLTKDRVPFVSFNQWWVPLCEFLGGAWLMLGFMTAFSAAVLTVVCVVACACEAREKVESYKPIDAADRIDDYLYLPEVLYVILLIATVFTGPGECSLDHYLWH